MRRSRLPLGKAVPLLLLLGGTLPAAGGAGTLANDQRASGKRGAVVTAHPIASQVGLEVLEKGGNAVDSAVAVFFALAVVHPQAGNLGGGGFMVARLMGAIRQESPREIALDFREVAPHRAERDMYLDERGKVVPGASLHTALAAGVPGSVAGICRAHELYGTLPFRDLLAPAIRLAEEGFEVDSFLHRAIAAKRKRFLAWRSTARIFLPGGKPPPVGSVFKQPELGKTLRRIARHGRDGFYRGETAGLIEREMQRSGGLIDREDLAAYEVKERKPLEGSYRGYRVLSMPPPSSGGVALLQMLNLLEMHDLRAKGFGSVDTLHLLVEVMKRAYADRARWLGDPDFYPVPVVGLTAKSYARKLARGLSLDKAEHSVQAGLPDGAVREGSRNTTHFSILDASGSAVALTTTLNSSFGSGQVVSGAGFLLNNEMDDFSAKPGLPNQFGLVGAKANEIAPGKRMLSSMTPTILLDQDGKKPLLVLGSPGGGRIINTVLQVILNVIDFELPLHLAVSAPRIHQQWRPRGIYWERLALSKNQKRALQARGHSFLPEPRSIGRCQAILWRRDGRIDAAADPRSGGAAKAW